MRSNFFNFLIGRIYSIFALIICLVFASTASLAEGKRVALVVGNGAYETVPQLPNPKNDAALVSETLRKQGFEVVTAVDLSRLELEKAVERYARALNGADISLFYYSGHGIEVGGENRIIPVDATLNEPQDLETQTYSLQTILLSMQSNSKAQLIYLDACRDNPFNDRVFLLGGDDAEKPAGKGLAEQKGAIGSLIAYATEPGKVALDGQGTNSPFTDAVIRHSFTQDTDVQSALMKVTEEVWEATQQSQRPWINSTLVKPIFLKGGTAKPLATDAPPMNTTLAELQLEQNTREVVADLVTVGVGPQAVFSNESASTLPNAKAYKLMQMPLSGTLSIEGQVLSEGSVVDFGKFKSLSFEPSTDVDAFRQSSTNAILVPAIVVETAAISASGSAFPVRLRIPQRIHECDLLAAEPLDVQGIGKGVELFEIDATQAMTACQSAVESHPKSVRYIYLAGRAQLAAGNMGLALQLMRQAADKGYVRAFHQLGLMAFNGQGMDKNLELANQLFQQAADKGDPAALFSLGRNLVKGQGVKPDVKRGIALLKRAAELGNTEALDEMGGLYLYGGALKPNPKRAVGFLEASVTRSATKTAKQKKLVFASYRNAATDVGKLFFEGTSVPRDLRQAAKWYEFGAERGNQGGIADLSWIFAEGGGDLRNPAKAVWYTSLALGTDGLRNDASLLQRLAGLPDDAKRTAMRDFVNLVGPCATQTTDGLDATLVTLSRKAWLHRQAENNQLELPSVDGTFSDPKGRGMDDELRYWNLVNAKDTDSAYLAYLEHFPDGVFADIARGRLGGLLQRLKLETAEAACAPPVRVKAPPKKSEPVRLLKQDPPKVKKSKPKPPPVVKKPVKKPKPPVKRPRRPNVVEEEIIVEEEEPEFEPPRRRRVPRFPRLPVPSHDQKCQFDDC